MKGLRKKHSTDVYVHKRMKDNKINSKPVTHGIRNKKKRKNKMFRIL